MTLEHSDARGWGTETLAARAGRRGKRRGWLTTPTLVLAKARQLDPRAISSLYSMYRRPLLSFLRQKGASGSVAEDVTQGFFAGAWRRGDFAKFQPVGSFGAWLRSGALRQLYNQQKHTSAKKRWLEAPQAAELCRELEERQPPAADRLLDQRRTALLIEKAWVRLRAAYQSLGRELLFDHLRRTLSRDERVTNEATDGALCEKLGISANHLAVLRHKLKTKEFPAALLAELNQRRSQEQGSVRPAAMLTVQEELRALLDDL